MSKIYVADNMHSKIKINGVEIKFKDQLGIIGVLLVFDDKRKAEEYSIDGPLVFNVDKNGNTVQ